MVSQIGIHDMKLLFYLPLSLFLVGCFVHKDPGLERVQKKSIVSVNSLVDSLSKAKSIKREFARISPAELSMPYNVEFKITRYYPYCGGAAPTPDKLNRYSPEVAEFVLVNLQTNEKITFKTDSLGIKRMLLANGHFSIKEKFKDVPFNVFYDENKRSSNNFYKSQGIECYKEWWGKNLIEFEITNADTILKIRTEVRDACFTGKNPCLIFTGPFPP